MFFPIWAVTMLGWITRAGIFGNKKTELLSVYKQLSLGGGVVKWKSRLFGSKVQLHGYFQKFATPSVRQKLSFVISTFPEYS